MKLRTTSNFLSDIISMSPTSTDLYPELYQLYLQSLGDKAYVAGTQIERIYNTGSFSLNEIFNELRDIRQKLSQPFLIEKDAQYFNARLNQVLILVKNFRDEFLDIERTIREIQKLYLGYDNVQGFSDIIKYFNENESKHEQKYNMEIVQQELDFEQEQMVQLIAIDYEVMRVGKSLDSYKKNLASFIERIIYLINKKIVTREDNQVSEEVLESVDSAKEIWSRMENNNRVLRIEA
jgi:hypothetical protein